MKSTALVFAFAFIILVAMALSGVAAHAQAPTEKTDAAKSASKPDGKKAKGKSAKTEKSAKATDPSLPKEVHKLIVQDTVNGQASGKVASKGKLIKVNYTGWLYDPSQPMGRGKQFDTSIGREPFQFRLGDGKVIKGWDEGFENMHVGGKRKLIIPADMGYGDKGAGVEIPPNSTLMFEVELVDVQ